MSANDETLSEKNYRDFAKRAIRQYDKMGQIIDALLWGKIISHYEAELKRLERKVKRPVT